MRKIISAAAKHTIATIIKKVRLSLGSMVFFAVMVLNLFSGLIVIF